MICAPIVGIGEKLRALLIREQRCATIGAAVSPADCLTCLHMRCLPIIENHRTSPKAGGAAICDRKARRQRWLHPKGWSEAKDPRQRVAAHAAGLEGSAAPHAHGGEHDLVANIDQRRRRPNAGCHSRPTVRTIRPDEPYARVCADAAGRSSRQRPSVRPRRLSQSPPREANWLSTARIRDATRQTTHAQFPGALHRRADHQTHVARFLCVLGPI